MSRLHNPGPGEILDRLTILALKITYGTLAGAGCAHWKDEQLSLFAGLSRDGRLARIITTEHMLELAATNAALWQAEDELRGYRCAHSDPEHDPIVARCGMRIQQLNDRRAELVSLINTNAGVPAPKEKL